MLPNSNACKDRVREPRLVSYLLLRKLKKSSKLGYVFEILRIKNVKCQVIMSCT